MKDHLIQVIKEPMRQVFCWTSYFQTMKNLLRMRSGTAFSDHEMVELRILRGGDEAKKAGLQLWTSKQQTLPFAGTCLEESCGVWSMREERSREAS